MQYYSEWLAKKVWIGMILFMKWKPVRRLRLGYLNRYTGEKRQEVLDAMLRQDRIAKRYGVKILTFAFMVFFSSALITSAYYFTLWAYNVGLAQPQE